VVLRQGGWTSVAKRVDESEAKRADAAFAERLRRKDERIAAEQRPRTAVTVDPRVLDRYVGLYTRGGPEAFSITREGDQLFASGNGRPRRPIFSERENEFFFKDASPSRRRAGDLDAPVAREITL
jgi:hypothetical protein